MKTTWRAELPQIAIIIGMFIAALVCWSRVTEPLPVHWNFAGDVDRYGSRFEGLLMIPLLSAGLYLLLLFIPRIDPGKSNYARFWNVYTVLRSSVIVFLAVVYASGIAAAFGAEQIMGRVVPLAVGALFIVIGNYLGKIRPNWFVGVRTPWTLSSKESWTKTHRLSGWLFMLMGLVVLAFGLTGQGWVLYTAMITGGISLVWMVVYSYLVWRNDPDRTPPAGTSATSE